MPIGIAADQPDARAQPVDIAITTVSIVDVERGRVLPPRTVLVTNGRIVGIEADANLPLPATAQRLDGRGRYLIPGLVDMHVHVFSYSPQRPTSEWSFPMYVAQGVTGVREMNCRAGDYAAQVARWNNAVADGALVAPRILAVGAAVRGPSPTEAGLLGGRGQAREGHLHQACTPVSPSPPGRQCARLPARTTWNSLATCPRASPSLKQRTLGSAAASTSRRSTRPARPSSPK